MKSTTAALNESLKRHSAQTALQPIETHRLYLSAASQIAEAISRGRWNPGDKLPSERELAKIFNISRSSVRQALTALEAIGVIRKRAGIGSFIEDDALEIIAQEIVTELVTEGDPLMVVEARQILEPELAKLAARRREPEDLAQMEAALQIMEAFDHGTMTPADFVSADIGFHSSVAQASHNPLLIRLFEEVADRMHHRVWLTAAYPVVARRAAAYEEHHRKIYEAIVKKQPGNARRMMEEHLRTIAENLVSISSISDEQLSSSLQG